MRIVGEICLLAAFVGSGFAAFLHVYPTSGGARRLRSLGTVTAIASLLALTVVMAILSRALLVKDFHFAYVAQYSSQQLPWYFSLSALWVGQAGSLLLWAWLTGMLAVLYRFRRGVASDPLRSLAFGILMAYTCFLVAIMVFAADPMAPNLSIAREGAGLSPLLQHPAMLIHPPVVFLGYSLWTVPFALAVAALLTNRLDTAWVRQARPWALMAWTVLGGGILLGAEWAYEELGWGGYWGWDPVENGSLLPWLTGTALIHALMTWQHRRALKKTTLVLALVTFGLCNFATFLTRSGVFSSLHAFSQSPIGWLFLVLMLAVWGGGLYLLVQRRHALAPEQPMRSVFSREACVVIGTMTLLLLAAVVLGGTLSMALSSLATGQTVMVGPAFYNNVLIPTGLILMLTTAVVPLLRWGQGPTPEQRQWLLSCGGAGVLAASAAVLAGIRQPIALTVIGAATVAVGALVASLILQARRHLPTQPWAGIPTVLRLQRRQYAGFLIHMGFLCLAIGITGSSLGKREQGFTLNKGQTVNWADRQIHLVRLHQRQMPDKVIAEAELRISGPGQSAVTLLPAQHFHRLQEVWTTEVAIQSSWQCDFYTILHSGEMDGPLYMTFVENPLMRCIWAGGGIMVLGAGFHFWPARRRRGKATAKREVRKPDSVAGDASRQNRRAAA